MTRMRLCITIACLVALAGCGGAAASAPPGSEGRPTATPVAQSDAPAPSAEPGGAATPTPAPATGGGGGGGGGGTAGVCELVTADELARIFDVTSVTTQVVAGPPDTCDIQADGAPLAAIVLMPSNGAAVFNAWASDPTSDDIPGLGDRALYSPQSLLLVVLKGDRALSMAALDESRSEEERLELMKEALAIAVGRL